MDESLENPWKFEQVHGSSKPPTPTNRVKRTHMGNGQM